MLIGSQILCTVGAGETATKCNPVTRMPIRGERAVGQMRIGADPPQSPGLPAQSSPDRTALRYRPQFMTVMLTCSVVAMETQTR